MTPEQRARKVTRQWAKDSHQYKHKKMGIKHYIAEAIRKEVKLERARIIRELDAKYNAEAERRINKAYLDGIQRGKEECATVHGATEIEQSPRSDR